VAARTKTMQLTVERTLSGDEVDDYVGPWRSPARATSWIAMAGAADPHYILDLLPGLKTDAVPTRLICGKDDDF
jgi:hypothetical protein